MNQDTANSPESSLYIVELERLQYSTTMTPTRTFFLSFLVLTQLLEAKFGAKQDKFIIVIQRENLLTIQI